MIAFVLALTTAALPPITTVPEAVTQLRSAQQKDALGNLKTACRGRYRRELIDKEPIKQQLESIFDIDPKKVLDTHVCFSAKMFMPLVQRGFASKDPSVFNYAAEVAIRFEDPIFVPLLLAEMEPRKADCLKTTSDEICVWLTYAPGALVANADDATKKKVAELATEMSKAAMPKIREVAADALKNAKSGRASK